MKDGQIDAIIDIALAHAKQRAAEWLGEKAAETIDPELGASALGARALMWAIESQLGGQPGLYLWHGGELAGSDRCRADDPRLTEAVQAGPLLILIHGTGSHTLGALKDLRASRTGSRSPGSSASGFSASSTARFPRARSTTRWDLPTRCRRARLSLVTHSRGGLVGDSLCLGALDDAAIDAYRRVVPVGKDEPEWQRRVREKVRGGRAVEANWGRSEIILDPA